MILKVKNAAKMVTVIIKSENTEATEASIPAVVKILSENMVNDSAPFVDSKNLKVAQSSNVFRSFLLEKTDFIWDK